MTAKIIECRWGILGCGSEAASFVAELQASGSKAAGLTNGAGGGSGGPTSSSSQVRHSIIAISSNNAATSRAFADSHIHTPNHDSATNSNSNSLSAKTSSAATAQITASSSSPVIETFGTSTELHAHPSIHSIFIASPQHSRYQEAVSALRGGKSVLISKPLAICSSEAKELCELASRKDKDKAKWLGFVMRAKSGSQSLLWAADECAKARADGLEQSPLLPWSDSLSLIEALDELRDAGAMRLPPDEDRPPAFPRMASEGASSSAINSPATFVRRLSTDTSRRPASRSSFSSDLGADDQNLSSATLRSQLHELKHVLRQKNALITSLELRGNAGNNSSIRTKSGGRNSLPPPRSNTNLATQLSTTYRRRTSSLDRTSSVASSEEDDSAMSPPQINMPLSDVINTLESGATAARSDSPTGGSFSRRKRRDANGGRRSATPDNNSLGLSTVKEANSTSLSLGEGFLAPTIASENRRMANTSAAGGTPKGGPTANGMNGLGSPIISPGSGGKGTSKVIESLTTELNSARVALDETKIQLRSSQRSLTNLQRHLDETKETLGRSRTENERLNQMMSRKERQNQEVLERARKAEVESKELGKSSREWGARVRKIEAELGEERILKQRAEVQYETISTSWKQIREAWEKEMKELRENQGDAVKRNREEVQKILAKFKAAEDSWRGREEEGKVLRGIIKELELERNRATNFVEGPVKELVTMLKAHEKHTSGQDAAVEEVQNELKRILRLMRSPS